MDKANAIRNIGLCIHAKKHKPRSARNGNRKTAGGRCSNRPLHEYAVMG